MSTSRNTNHSELLDALERWATAQAPALAERAVEIAYRRTDAAPKPAAWIEAEGPSRAGQVTLWETGETDLQVHRADDGTLVVNEHRRLTSTLELDELLQILVLAVTYAGSGS